MNDKTFTPQPILTLESLESLKIISDPLRNQILEVLTPAPHTVNEVANKLGEESSKLYYHFNLLEKHGIIRVVETSIIGNLIEKRYWITAYKFDVAEEVFNFNVETPEGTEQIIDLLLTNINATREDLRRSMYARHQQISLGAEPTPRSVFDTRIMLNLADDKAAEFHARLNELVKEFKQEEESLAANPEEKLPWALSIIFYPSFYFESEETGNHAG